MDDTYPLIKMVSEGSILVEYEEEVSLEVNHKARQLAFGLEQGSYPGLEGVISTYRSAMVYFDPFRVDVDTVRGFIEHVNGNLVEIELPPPRLLRIPTTYGNIHGPDLDRVAKHTRLNPDEVTELFSAQAYPVYFLGFICSLAYLGGVPEALHVPRLATPRECPKPCTSPGLLRRGLLYLPVPWALVGRRPIFSLRTHHRVSTTLAARL
jgi:KipI family sensor histidine kinase inhibitor